MLLSSYDGTLLHDATACSSTCNSSSALAPELPASRVHEMHHNWYVPHILPIRQRPLLGVVWTKRRLFLSNGVIAFFDRRMAHGTEGAKLFALIVSGNERHLDAGVGDVAALKAKTRIRVGPTLSELSSVASRLRPIDTDPVNDLHWPAGMHVATEQDLDVRCL